MINRAGFLIGIFALIVGMISIANIMFVSVKERTNIIGIKKSIGAKRYIILLEFLLEAIVLSIIGGVVGLILVGRLEGFTEFIIPFAAGNFLYIAASNLVPQLHRDCKLKDTLLHLFAIVLGIGIITLVTLYGPAHGH